MSAETLRRAAEAIRKDQFIEENLGHIDDRAFEAWLAVAGWLELVALRWPTGRSSVTRERFHALAVARAYLGEGSA